MALIRLMVVLALAFFAGACASKTPTRSLKDVPTEVLEEQLQQVRVNIVNSEGNEKTLRANGVKLESEEMIRVRARQIELRNREEVILSVLERRGGRSEKTARRQLQREADNIAKVEKINQDAVKEAALEGCDPATVGVKAYGQDFNIFAIFPVTLMLRVTNNSSIPVTIETAFRGLGTVVKNLCAGGSINVSFRLRWEDPQMANIPIIVRGVLPNGRNAEENRMYFLSKYQAQNNRVDYQSWSVNLDNR